MKSILVAVKSIQRDNSGEDTVIELVSPGRYYEKNGVKYIVYDETEVTGMEGVKTTIKLYPQSMILLRNGNVKMRHQYVLGNTHDTIYETPMGQLEMSVKTHELDIDVNTDGIGHVHLGYDISVGGSWQFYNQLDIDLQEDT